MVEYLKVMGITFCFVGGFIYMLKEVLAVYGIKKQDGGSVMEFFFGLLLFTTSIYLLIYN